MNKRKEYLINKFIQIDEDLKSFDIHLVFLKEMKTLLDLVKDNHIIIQVYKIISSVREYYN